MTLKWLRHGESGQNVILVAVSMIAMLAMMALVLDGGFLLVQRRRMQNAADAAAIAGARELALGLDDTAIDTRIRDYAVDFNGADEDMLEASYAPGGELIGNGAIPEGATGVRVKTEIEFPAFFAGVIGQNTLATSASAEARFGAVRSTGALVPMATHCDPGSVVDVDECDEDDWDCLCPESAFQRNHIYELWGTKTGPGGFGWLDWDGPPVGTPELADNIRNPNNSGVWQKDWLVPSGPGVKNSAPVSSALDEWFEKDWEDRHFTIIVYDYTQGGGANLRYHIRGFAEFALVGYNFEGSDKWIKGEFRRWVKPSTDLDLDTLGKGVTGVVVTR